MDRFLSSQVCIVGAGPAGAMLAMLLARQGIHVILIEKSNHSKREFRGESISPDSVALLDQLKIMSYIENHGYLKTKRMQIFENRKCLVDVDFSKFNYNQKYTIDVPQAVLISALITEANKHPNFTFLPGTQCDEFIIDNEKISGIVCTQDNGKIHIRSQLVVGADGRYGKIRKLADLPATVSQLSRDVLWFMVTKPAGWGEIAKLCIDKGHHIIILPTYPNLLRIGFNIPSGKYKLIRQQPISYLYQMIDKLEPALLQNVKQEVTSWSKTTLLDIFTMELTQWARDGLILIGDASHTLSPVLGQGVNQALLDSVELASILDTFFSASKKHICPINIFDNFVKTRKQEKNFIHAFQVRQEKILSMDSHFMTFIRRISYRFMNKSPYLQNKLWGRLLYQYQHKMR